MKRIEVLFLSSVFLVAAVFSLMSVVQAVRLYPGRAEAPVGAAGQPRDVDMEKLQYLLRQGRLSDREAEYYQEYRGPPALRRPAAEATPAGSPTPP